jgi:hypothetical protein
LPPAAPGPEKNQIGIAIETPRDSLQELARQFLQDGGGVIATATDEPMAALRDNAGQFQE